MTPGVEKNSEKNLAEEEYCCDAALRALIELIGSIVKSYCVDGAWNDAVVGARHRLPIHVARSLRPAWRLQLPPQRRVSRR